jgi:hypothetical protein
MTFTQVGGVLKEYCAAVFVNNCNYEYISFWYETKIVYWIDFVTVL